MDTVHSGPGFGHCAQRAALLGALLAVLSGAAQAQVYGQPPANPQPPVYAPPAPNAQPPVYGHPVAPLQSPAMEPPAMQPPMVAPSSPAPQVRAFQAPTNGRMVYRGFTIDGTAILRSPDYAAIMASMPHQIDIASDCGLRPEVISFFQSRVIILRPGLRGQFGRFDPRYPGVSIEDAVAAPQKPIVLHELLHAYHWYMIPGGFQNPQIMTFYNRAKDLRRYQEGVYAVKNVQEFFATTGSLYLWGHIDRPPYSREGLKAAQPIYYKWLGDFFGVQK